ncbi:hypothetical protein [Nonomuraea sp. NPDC049784]|uniref:hypothetical protein n=1 Tax=Nonomuraea sp. NPDC049784 TaxID=3154361 RepID=UPI0033F71245
MGGSALYAVLAITIGVIAGLLSGIVLRALGADMVQAVTSGGGAFVAITGLAIGIFHYSSKKP